MQFEGDVNDVLNAVVLGHEGHLDYFAPGAMMCAVQTAYGAVKERFIPHNTPASMAGVSGGGWIAHARSCERSRQLGKLFFQDLCSQEFISNTWRSLWQGRVMNLDHLETSVRRELSVLGGVKSQGHRLLVGTTVLESGEFRLHACDPENVDETIALLRASSSIPGICADAVTIDGEVHIDGAVSNQLPVQELLAVEKPRSLLIHLPYSEQSLGNGKPDRQESWFYKTIARHVPAHIRSATLDRNRRLIDTVTWIRTQLAMPIGTPERILPHTCLVWGDDSLDPLCIDSKKIKRALYQGMAGWRHALNEVGFTCERRL